MESKSINLDGHWLWPSVSPFLHTTIYSSLILLMITLEALCVRKYCCCTVTYRVEYSPQMVQLTWSSYCDRPEVLHVLLLQIIKHCTQLHTTDANRSLVS